MPEDQAQTIAQYIGVERSRLIKWVRLMLAFAIAPPASVGIVFALSATAGGSSDKVALLVFTGIGYAVGLTLGAALLALLQWIERERLIYFVVGAAVASVAARLIMFDVPATIERWIDVAHFGVLGLVAGLIFWIVGYWSPARGAA